MTNLATNLRRIWDEMYNIFDFRSKSIFLAHRNIDNYI